MRTTTPYGTYMHGKVSRGDTGGYLREDTWEPANGTPRVADTMQAASMVDDSRVYTGAYDPACACCWLGHGHTDDKHAQALEIPCSAQSA
jgi:hypothetical protein